MTPYQFVFITVPSGAAARRLTNEILSARLAACVNALPGVESKYWWKGALETSRETLLIVKARKVHYHRLVALVSRVHPYAVPEIVALSVAAGNKPYLQWLAHETSKLKK